MADDYRERYEKMRDERDTAFLGRALLWVACLTLLGLLLLASYRPARPAACVSSPSEVMQLDPTTVRASGAEVYEL